MRGRRGGTRLETCILLGRFHCPSAAFVILAKGRKGRKAKKHREISLSSFTECFIDLQPCQNDINESIAKSQRLDHLCFFPQLEKQNIDEQLAAREEQLP